LRAIPIVSIADPVFIPIVNCHASIALQASFGSDTTSSASTTPPGPVVLVVPGTICNRGQSVTKHLRADCSGAIEEGSCRSGIAKPRGVSGCHVVALVACIGVRRAALCGIPSASDVCTCTVHCAVCVSSGVRNSRWSIIDWCCCCWTGCQGARSSSTELPIRLTSCCDIVAPPCTWGFIAVVALVSRSGLTRAVRCIRICPRQICCAVADGILLHDGASGGTCFRTVIGSEVAKRRHASPRYPICASTHCISI
jgi:hypothetical protein